MGMKIALWLLPNSCIPVVGFPLGWNADLGQAGAVVEGGGSHRARLEIYTRIRHHIAVVSQKEESCLKLRLAWALLGGLGCVRLCTSQGLHSSLGRACWRGEGAGCLGTPGKKTSVRQVKEKCVGFAAAALQQNIAGSFELFFQCVRVSGAVVTWPASGGQPGWVWKPELPAVLRAGYKLEKPPAPDCFLDPSDSFQPN